MGQVLHESATTTEAVRRAIQHGQPAPHARRRKTRKGHSPRHGSKDRHHRQRRPQASDTLPGKHANMSKKHGGRARAQPGGLTPLIPGEGQAGSCLFLVVSHLCKRIGHLLLYLRASLAVSSHHEDRQNQSNHDGCDKCSSDTRSLDPHFALFQK